jgi:hypothetical protein
MIKFSQEITNIIKNNKLDFSDINKFEFIYPIAYMVSLDSNNSLMSIIDDLIKSMGGEKQYGSVFTVGEKYAIYSESTEDTILRSLNLIEFL